MTDKKLAPWLDNPYRLVSLGEIMEQFYPVQLMSVTQVLTNMIERTATVTDNTTLFDETRKSGKDVLPGYAQICDQLALTASRKTIQRTLELLDEPTATWGQLRKLYDELRGRLKDELEGRLFLYVDDATYYINPRDGWEMVIDRFNDTALDIEESSKCLALNRYAASIYHVLQVADIGTIELGRVIGVSDPLLGFTATDERLKLILRTKREELTDFERDNHEELEQLSQSIEAMKTAWRNKISHIQGRSVLLPESYSRDIASEIIIATRGFMRRLVKFIGARKKEVSVYGPGNRATDECFRYFYFQ